MKKLFGALGILLLLVIGATHTDKVMAVWDSVVVLVADVFTDAKKGYDDEIKPYVDGFIEEGGEFDLYIFDDVTR